MTAADPPVRVLVLEDDDAHTELIQEAFGQDPGSFLVTYTTFLREAREVLLHQPQDIILSDWLLPDGKGIDILQREEGHVMAPLVIMTSHGNEKLAVELMKSGAIDYIVKSDFTFRELPHTVRRILREWENICRREAADRALLRQREYYETILENVHSGVWVSSRDDIIEYANEGIARIAGVPASALTGQSVFSNFPEDTVHDFLAYYRRAKETKTTVFYDSVPVVTPAGRMSYQSGELIPRIGDGKYLGMICTVLDVTEKKLAEDSLRESEARFRNYIDSAPEGVFLADEKGDYFFVNDVACKTTGYSREELLQKNLINLIYTEDIPLASSHFQCLVETGMASGEMRFVTRTGEVRWWSVKAVRLNPVQFLGFTSDITDRKRAEDSLRESRETLASILESITESVFLMTAEGTIIEANQTTARRLGFPGREEMIGKNVWEVIPPEVVPYRREMVAGVVNTGLPARFEDERNGHTLSSTLFPVSDSAGRVTRIAVFGMDVTDRRRAEGAVIRLNECLLGLSNDAAENISRIVGLCGELLDASFVLFNNLEGDRCITTASWHKPDGLPEATPMRESLCYEVYRQDKPLMVIEDLQDSPYAQHYPSVRRFGLCTYAGHTVRYHGEAHGTLCILYTSPKTMTGADRNLLGLIASAIGREEERRIAAEALQASEERFRAQYQNSPLAIFTWQRRGDDYILIDCNKTALARSNGRVTALLGSSARTMYAERPELLEKLNHCYTDKTVMTFEVQSQNYLPGRHLLTTAAYIPPDMILIHDEDITESKLHRDAQDLSNRIFLASYRHNTVEGLMEECSAVLKDYSRCACTGIRLLEPDGTIPYSAYIGFPREFYELESPLNIEHDECMCINVIKGATDPDLPFYTDSGSFYMNATTKFLATVSEEEKGRTRNECNRSGYESVALIPIRDNERITGLIHLADPDEGMVPLLTVRVMERIGTAMGEAIKRIRMESSLRESEERFREVFDRLPIGMWIADRHGTLLSGNVAGQKIWDAHPHVGQEEYGVFRAWRMPGREPVRPDEWALGYAVNEGRITESELLEIEAFNGSHKLILNWAIPLKNPAGEITGAFVLNQDVTEKAAAEGALRESEERFRNIADLLPTTIYEATPDGTLTFANRAAYAMFGYTPEEFTQGVHFSQFVVPTERERAAVRWKEILAGSAQVQSQEYYFVRRDGTTFPGIITNAPITKGEKITGVRGTILDITDLRESEKRLAFALTASKSGAWDWDMVTGTMHWSPELKAQLGLSADSPATFDNWMGALFSEDRDRAIAATRRSIADHTPLRNEYRVLTPEGQIRWIEAVGTTVYADDGKAVRMSGICIDITGKKQADAALELARRKLNLLNTVTFQDIQSLVFSTSAYINLIRTSNDPDKTKEYLERENELVRQISGCLDFTHNYQNLGMLAPCWHKMRDVIIYAISHLNFSDITKTIDLDNLEVYADPLLEKAMVHIIQNVIEGAGKTGAVRVSASESDGGITIYIGGDNAGIPSEEKDTLFQHSFGGHRGLGLFLSREILSITGITIRETGIPGKNTQFEIRVPRGAFRNHHQ